MEMDTWTRPPAWSADPPFDILDHNNMKPTGFSSLLSSGTLFSQSMDDLPSMEGLPRAEEAAWRPR